MALRSPYANVSRRLVTHDAASDGVRAIPEEIAVAFTYGSADVCRDDGQRRKTSRTTLSASHLPKESSIVSEIEAIEIVPHEQGVERDDSQRKARQTACCRGGGA